MLGDTDTMKRRLQSTSYYRLSGYFYFFRAHQGAQRHLGEEYRPGLHFDKVWELYTFDCKLRTLVQQAIEKIEIAVRTQVSYHHARKFGPFAYAEDPAALALGTRRLHNGTIVDRRTEFLNEIDKCLERSHEQFVDHFYENYDHRYPPLWIAAEEYPDLDVEAYVDRIDELAEAARRKIFPCVEEDRAARFNDFMFRELGFAGNTESYGDPRNSFLNEVLDRRLGIPISLSLVYTEIGSRIGLPVVGVGFPGHFLIRWLGPREVLVDAFHGKVVSRGECEERLQSGFGPQAALDERMLEPATPREILTRWLRNLKHNYLGSVELDRALRIIDRILTVSPDDPGELRDRGVLYFRLECYAAALADLERYLVLAPNDAMAGQIRARLPELRREAARLQ